MKSLFVPAQPATVLVLLLLSAVLLFSPPAALAQATISTGSIQGTVSDPSGAVVCYCRERNGTEGSISMVSGDVSTYRERILVGEVHH